MSRGWRVAALAVAATVAYGGASAPPAADLPRRSLLILVAPWCGPCWDELRRIDALAAAAAPLSLRVVAMEEGPRARAMLASLPPERRWSPDPAVRAAVRAALWARTPGLPHAVATDAAGTICAEHGGTLAPATARSLAARCVPVG